MIAHHIRLASDHSLDAVRIVVVLTVGLNCISLDFNKPIHFAAINIGKSSTQTVTASGIDNTRIMIGFDTLFSLWIRYAYGWNAVLHGDSICTGISAEVRIE